MLRYTIERSTLISIVAIKGTGLFYFAMSTARIFYKASSLHYHVHWVDGLGLGGRARLQVIILICMTILIAIEPLFRETVESTGFGLLSV